EILSKTGMTDFSAYNCVAGHQLMADFFLGAAPARMPVPVESSKATLMAIVEEARKAREKASEAAVTEVDAGAAVETSSGDVAAQTAETVVSAEEETGWVSGPAESPYKSFAVSQKDEVAYLSFNNPARLNCLGVNFFEELPRAITAMEESGVRALVIEAAVGRHFSSGLDLNVLANESLLKVDTEGDKIRLNGLILSWQKALSSVANARFPVIAAVDGLCLGAALDLVSACDFCLATKDAQFSIEEINVGLMADLGSLQRLPRRIPESVVRYLAFTGEKMSAHAAQAAGLVLTVYDNSDALGLAAQVMAKKIAAKEASAITASKMALNFNHGHTLEESLAECARLQTIWINPERVMSEVRRIATKQ
ncbi:MAG TPA: enoyl-CoA hydratase-related protein, partial [Candidatus Obscuribacter sp.]|nr:enoyl-CoA hydratase-related protein [Candidatus Obscuribacter sp.]